MADVLINGEDVHSEADLHRVLEAQIEFGEHYGRNLAALRDRLLTDVPRPVRIVWIHSRVSQTQLGNELFNRIVEVFEEAVQQDRSFGWVDRAEFDLR